ncbi:hypothetical protein [Stenotrophomonas maltophilia]|uniref:hypothetical protein n=1 Tax=Stenotrophomonas maltophilia TaxID=40324 RepID=UPI0038776C02
MRTSFFILSVLCLGLLSGCASGPEVNTSSREITAAFVADDGQLYLLPRFEEPMRFNAAPFREYRALMDSPLREAVACAQMYFHEDWRDPANKSKVHGSYALLLRPEQVTPEQAAQFRLEWIEVIPREAKSVDERARYYLPQDRTRYALAFDRACNLSTKGGSYYSVLFEGDGERVKLPDAAALAEKAKLAQPISARAQRIQPEDADKPGVGTAAGKVLGAALIPVAVPVFVLSLPFLGPDHWK